MKTPNNHTIDLYGDGISKVQYIQHMGNDKTIVNAARVSFGQDCEGEVTERDKKLIRYLIKNRHTSTLEHNVITFKFTVPLFVRSQHHRHRTWSYNEISRRYTDAGIEFFHPDDLRTQHKSNRQASEEGSSIDPMLHNVAGVREGSWFEGLRAKTAIKVWCQMAIVFYSILIQVGVSRELARMVLPQNLYTEYYGTVNLNNLIKFLSLRMDGHAQKEIQDVANACFIMAKELWPTPMKEFERGFNATRTME